VESNCNLNDCFFGILGLITEFKDPKTQKITKWGFASLLGILLSTVFGIYSQMLETADQNEQKTEAARRTLRILAAEQQSIAAIEKLLTLLDEPTFWGVFRVSCKVEDLGPLADAPEGSIIKDKLVRFCKLTDSYATRDEWPDFIWSQWPFGSPSLGFSLLFVKNDHASALEKVLSSTPPIGLFGGPKEADWYM
jgi:predicted outer membrane lipoprotein